MATPPPAFRPTVLLLFAGMLVLAGGVVLAGIQVNSERLMDGGLQLCATVIGAAAMAARDLMKGD